MTDSRSLERANGRRWRSGGTATVCLLLCVGAACRNQASELQPDAGSTLVASGGSISTGVTTRDGKALAVRPADPPSVSHSSPPPVVPPLSARERVGQSIFSDASLSNPPGTSCASCHDPAAGFSSSNGAESGVARGSRPGHFTRRNAPSLLYLKYVPPFHFALEDDDDVDESPLGGLTWSGRADTIAEFVRSPLLDADEMNDKSEAEIAAKLRAAPYAADFARAFPGALDTPASAMKSLGEALQAFLTSETMSPFTSKFDDFLRGKTQLSPLEMKGLTAFESRAKGACIHCHTMYSHSNRPESSLFTNFFYDAVGIPRNRALAANADPQHYDLGLCERTTKKEAPSSNPKWCGFFRVPSLRNVAVRQRFMHNGSLSKLRDVVAFYATRSTDPDRWYPHGAKYDDVPAAYKRNINEVAFPYNGHPGEKAAFDDDDIDAIVAFLNTLTDEPYRSRVATK